MSKERQIDILLVFFWHWQWCQGAPKAMAPMPECPQTHVSSAGVPQDQSHWCWVPPSAPSLLVLDGFYDHQGVNKNKTPFWWRRECASAGRGLCEVESSNQSACTACVYKDPWQFSELGKSAVNFIFCMIGKKQQFFFVTFTLETKSHSSGQL